MKKLDRKSVSPFKNTCLCTILPPPFCEMYTCYWIYLVWNNKYIWQWKVVLNFRFTKLLHNLKPLDSRHLRDQVNMSVIDKRWLYIAGNILEFRALFNISQKGHFLWKRELFLKSQSSRTQSRSQKCPVRFFVKI